MYNAGDSVTRTDIIQNQAGARISTLIKTVHISYKKVVLYLFLTYWMYKQIA